MPRSHFPIGFDEPSGFNCLQHGAAHMRWQGDAGLSCAGAPIPMSPGIRVPISLPAHCSGSSGPCFSGFPVGTPR